MMSLIGLVLPPLVDVVVKLLNVVNDKVKVLVTFVVCLAVQLGLTYLENQFMFPSLKEASEYVGLGTFALMGIANASYLLAWKDADMRKDLSLKSK